MSKPFGPYTLEKRLATGGAGKIYLASGPHGRVVLKIATAKEDPTFAKEARILQRLRDPHVVSVFDYGTIDGRWYLALEFVAGRDLATLQLYTPRFSVDEAIVVAADAAMGLHAAHMLRDDDGKAFNLVHRDVSPQNILLAHTGHAKLTDFGVAKLAGELRTATGIIKGKFEYIAPEHASGDPIDRRADLFSLGLVIYELLAGQPAYHSADDYELIEMARECAFRPLAELAPDVPKPLLKAVARALARDKDERYMTGKEMSDAFTACRGAREDVVRRQLAMRVQAVNVQGHQRD